MNEVNRRALAMGVEMDRAFDETTAGKAAPISANITFYVETTADGASVLGTSDGGVLTPPVIGALIAYLQERKAA